MGSFERTRDSGQDSGFYNLITFWEACCPTQGLSGQQGIYNG